MPSRLWTATIQGIEAIPVMVEVDVSPGLGSVTVVGLADTAVQEARERVRAALKNSEFPFPRHRVTINLAPADVKKEGPLFDLPIALGILAAVGEDDVPFIPTPPSTWMFCGELGLDGTLRRVDGVIAIALSARASGCTHLVVPPENAGEAALIRGITVLAPATLKDLVAHLREERALSPVIASSTTNPQQPCISFATDLSSIQGQESAKRALQIAAAGSHNLLMTGPPGSGKTLLARTLVSILPSMTEEESIDVMVIYSITGLLPSRGQWMRTRPFRSPHHTSSDIALVGGGAKPRPGEISLAHRGVLFLDELPEFDRNVLESLRQPLEDGTITVARATSTLQFPAKFMLVASCNPCPCGYAGTHQRPCVCSASQIIKYQKKISGPLIDRIDLVVDVPSVPTEQLLSPSPTGPTSEEIRSSVERARIVQRERLHASAIFTNAEMNNQHVREHCRIDTASRELLERAIDRYRLSARSYFRILKLARTIADLEGSEAISRDHLAEALQYRPRSTEI